VKNAAGQQLMLVAADLCFHLELAVLELLTQALKLGLGVEERCEEVGIERDPGSQIFVGRG
jgi:hypothetical protein